MTYNNIKFKKINRCEYLIPRTGKMRTDGLVFADEGMISDIEREKSASQVANMATLPGIAGRAMGMPDIHYGYGFPIGGVAAFDTDEGVISPGGIGYDINCGVRLLRTGLDADSIDKLSIAKLCDLIFNKVPSGVGSSGMLSLSDNEMHKVLKEGSGWAVGRGIGEKKDLEYTEDNGAMQGADPSVLSPRAIERGKYQLGTLGAGNHFLELQRVSEVFDEEAAKVYGLRIGQLVIMVHTGSRGLGYQVCDDYLRVMRSACLRYRIELEDRQLACAPFKSGEGQKYFAAMKCAANYAWANRQCITHLIREAVNEALGGTQVELLWDLCHNIGKIEEHGGRKLIVHRKGATRAFGPGRMEVPDAYRKTGQPVIIPGTMGTSSYLMKGTEKAMEKTFGSTCHGAGRVWSRSRALNSLSGRQVKEELENRGITIRAKSSKTIAEEAPAAYKDVSRVVDICRQAGISEKVARMEPLGVIKG